MALADVAGAVKEGLLGFASADGDGVLYQMLDAEMTARVGPKHAKIPGPHRRTGTAPPRGRWCLAAG